MKKNRIFITLVGLSAITTFTACQGTQQGQNVGQTSTIIINQPVTSPVPVSVVSTPTPTPIPSPTAIPTPPPVEFTSVITLAGTGEKGYLDGTQKTAKFNAPFSVAVDKSDNVFVADIANHVIRKIDPNGNTSTFAGKAEQKGFADGAGTAAQFNEPNGLIFDKAGNLYVADSRNYRIRKIDPLGNVTTIAGTGEQGFGDGPALEAKFDDPMGMVFDAQENLYIVDEANNKIRKIDTNGNVSTYAGSGVKGNADGSQTTAQFNSPSAITMDSKGNFYVLEFNNHVLRKIDAQGNVTTFAGSRIQGLVDGKGTIAQFYYPQGISIDEYDNIYVADSYNNRIRKIDGEGNVSTIAGSGEGFLDAIPVAAKFKIPSGLAFDIKGNLYVADTDNNAIRKLQRK